MLAGTVAMCTMVLNGTLGELDILCLVRSLELACAMTSERSGAFPKFQ